MAAKGQSQDKRLLRQDDELKEGRTRTARRSLAVFVCAGKTRPTRFRRRFQSVARRRYAACPTGGVHRSQRRAARHCAFGFVGWWPPSSWGAGATTWGAPRHPRPDPCSSRPWGVTTRRRPPPWPSGCFWAPRLSAFSVPLLPKPHIRHPTIIQCLKSAGLSISI